MDQQRKIELLVKCDFSKWRRIKRAKLAGETPLTVSGTGNLLQGMGVMVSNIIEGNEVERFLEITLNNYRIMKEDYETVPFDEMDINDPDFKFLFDFKKGLDELGRKVYYFVCKVRENSMTVSPDWSESQELEKKILELDRMDYRKQVLEKYGVAYSDPIASS